MLWCDYKPTSLDEFGYNNELIQKLKKLAKNIKKNKILNNIAFYGIDGTGKKTLCDCFLSEIYGDIIYIKKKEKFISKQNCSNYNIDISISKYHYEISLCGLQFADKSVLMNFIDTYFSTLDFNDNGYKILIIKDFDTLSKPAQFALRRKMEKNINSVRFIFIIKNISKIEPSLISRLTIIRCRKITNLEFFNKIKKIANLENIKISNNKINEIIDKSNNIGSCLFYLYLLKNNKQLLVNPTDNIINDLLKCIYMKPYPIIRIRDIISEIQLSKISYNIIFKKLLEESLNIFTDENKLISINKCAYYEAVSKKSKKFTICLEAYITFIYSILHI